MPAFFPALLPGEALFSALARFGDQLALESDRALARLAFDLPKVSAAIDIPTNVAEFLASAPRGYGVDANRVFEKHSALPYYSALVGTDARQQALNDALKGDSRTAGARLGAFNGARTPKRLQFCSICADRDRDTHGAPYWHIVHQLPGVVVCSIHDELLFESEFARPSTKFPSFRSLAAALKGCTQRAAVPDEFVDLARHAAVVSTQLLTSRPPFDARQSRALLRGRAAELGLGHKARGLDREALIERLASRLGNDVLAVLGSGFNGRMMAAEGRTTRWVLNLLNNQTVTSHPLAHILAAFALETSLETLGTPRHTVGKEAESAPCLNLTCRLHVQTGDRRPGMGHRCESCGYAYRITPTGKQRVLTTGALWDAALRRLVIEGTATEREMSKALGQKASFFKRRALELGIRHPRWSDKAVATVRDEAKKSWDSKREGTIATYRRRWLVLRDAMPHASRTELIAVDAVTYGALNKHDAAWLRDNLPARRASGGNQRSDDWAARDRKTAIEVRRASQGIRRRPGRPIRVSRAQITKSIGRSDLSATIGRMPITHRTFEREVETQDTFALRRLVRATVTFAVDGIVPSPAKLIEAANIKPKMLRLHRHTIVNLCDLVEQYVALEAPLPRSFALIDPVTPFAPLSSIRVALPRTLNAA